MLSLLKLFHAEFTGLSRSKVYVDQAAWREGQVAALYEGWLGWQTAPGGMGLINWPPRVLLRAFQAEREGQLGDPGVALQILAVARLRVPRKAIPTITMDFGNVYMAAASAVP